MPVSSAYRPDPQFQSLGPDFADPVEAATFPERTARFLNQDWAERVGLGGLVAHEWENHFARFKPLPDNMPTPLAMRYHGHQFRVYNPDIGDGRGFLYAQLRDGAGRLLDLATKGSGQTPYSRFGDGRLTLKGGVREVLAAQMLEATGVNTSKAFALYETGEALERTDEPSPTRSAVLTRLSHSHIRFGTFQRLSYLERPDLMIALLNHCIAHYYPHLEPLDGDAAVEAFYGEVVAASARLASQWMAAGFVHGVLNTDNLNITGESFDYGPWRFLPTSAPGFVAAYFDEQGLYAFGRQPEAVSWALSQLGGALSTLCPAEQLEPHLRRFVEHYRTALRDAVFASPAIAARDIEDDLQFLQNLFAWMTDAQVGWQQFFHDWRGGGHSAIRAADGPHGQVYDALEFSAVRRAIEARTGVKGAASHPYFQRPVAVTMTIEDVEAIWEPIAERNDWSKFQDKLNDIALMRAALAPARR
ncbi:MAG: YdiU family protein [Alphaproteobacteria bacterium]|nr:YdiU family protein [Alphaproteobacteria bacterium]